MSASFFNRKSRWLIAGGLLTSVAFYGLNQADEPEHEGVKLLPHVAASAAGVTSSMDAVPVVAAIQMPAQALPARSIVAPALTEPSTQAQDIDDQPDHAARNLVLGQYAYKKYLCSPIQNAKKFDHLVYAMDYLGDKPEKAHQYGVTPDQLMNQVRQGALTAAQDMGAQRLPHTKLAQFMLYNDFRLAVRAAGWQQDGSFDVDQGSLQTGFNHAVINDQKISAAAPASIEAYHFISKLTPQDVPHLRDSELLRYMTYINVVNYALESEELRETLGTPGRRSDMLGVVLESWYGRSAQMRDLMLEELYRRAVANTATCPPDHPNPALR